MSDQTIPHIVIRYSLPAAAHQRNIKIDGTTSMATNNASAAELELRAVWQAGRRADEIGRIGWINRAERFETQQERLNQMLDELEQSDLYMKMDYRPRAPDG